MLAFPDETSCDQMRSGVLDCAAHRNRNSTYSSFRPKIAACASVSGVAVGAMCRSIPGLRGIRVFVEDMKLLESFQTNCLDFILERFPISGPVATV
jgi:hypothetical protein